MEAVVGQCKSAISWHGDFLHRPEAIEYFIAAGWIYTDRKAGRNEKHRPRIENPNSYALPFELQAV